MLKRNVTLMAISLLGISAQAQSNPAITQWMQNTTQIGSYYVSGNSTPISNNLLVNCQQVEYSATSVYVTATGIPSYPTGPFLDGNPSNAQDQSTIFKIPLNPIQNTGTLTEGGMGNIGVFINGTALFNYADGVSWDPSTAALCGGPPGGNPPCPGVPGSGNWNRDAIPAEMDGFDCSKGHPAMGNYHHHQNPSAFKLDLNVISTICNLYDADGLYAMNSTQHSPLIGFAYDGFPIYGAYAYADVNGTGGIVRMKSSYELSSSTTRANGPNVDATYFNGYFKEDYSFVSHPENDYLDEHNGRFCVTPEYPNGIYCYFATVDENWNSAYPYAVGPTFYGVYSNASVNNISESTTVYTGTTGISDADFESMKVNIYPNPAADLIAIQINGLVKDNLQVNLFDLSGKLIRNSTINSGSTIAYFDVQSVYEGTYIIQIENGNNITARKVVVVRAE